MRVKGKGEGTREKGQGERRKVQGERWIYCEGGCLWETTLLVGMSHYHRHCEAIELEHMSYNHRHCEAVAEAILIMTKNANWLCAWGEGLLRLTPRNDGSCGVFVLWQWLSHDGACGVCLLGHWPPHDASCGVFLLGQ
jgi:hypothetical protein